VPVDVDAATVPATGVKSPPLSGLVRTLGWPGGGVQLTLAPAPGKRDAPDWSSARLLREDGSVLVSARAALPDSSGITALLVSPASDAADHAAQLEAASALVSALPPGERIGIWLGSPGLPLVCEVTERREHALARLAAIMPSASRAAIEPDQLRNLQEHLTKLGGKYDTPSRVLVSVGSPASDVAGMDALPTLRLGQVTAPADDAFAWDGQTSPADAGRALAAAIVHSREQAFRLSACDVETGERLVLELGDEHIEAHVPAPPGELSVRCDATAVARDDYPFPDVLSLVLDEAQLAEHDRLAAAKDESDFMLQVAFGDGAPVPATAHFRGQTSLDCDRKNYSVHFMDDEQRRLIANAHGNEFLLVSMCWDKGWFRQVLATRIMHTLGLFPLQQRYVKLRVGGRELGVYMMLEKPDEALRNRQSELAALIRRRFDPLSEPPEPRYPKPSSDPDLAMQAVQKYEDMIALVDTVDPGALYGALASRLDLDGYLRWLALMTYFQNGDYADEVFFYASDESAAGGGWYFRNHGWDADDLFTACHHDGQYAYADPHGILYCAEGKLDKALIVSPEVYARFAALLSELIAGPLGPDTVSRELDEIHEELSTLLSDDPTCQGTGLVIDDVPATCDTLKPWLRYEVESFEMMVRARATMLSEQLASVDSSL
jgi:hypothetical protein